MSGVKTILKRRDFLAAAASGNKCVMPGVVVQTRDRGDDDLPRFGVTASKKVGAAVQRNRAKRRLRALATPLLSAHGQQGHDYVLIARYNTVGLAWEKLDAEFMRFITGQMSR